MNTRNRAPSGRVARRRQGKVSPSKKDGRNHKVTKPGRSHRISENAVLGDRLGSALIIANAGSLDDFLPEGCTQATFTLDMRTNHLKLIEHVPNKRDVQRLLRRALREGMFLY